MKYAHGLAIRHALANGGALSHVYRNTFRQFVPFSHHGRGLTEGVVRMYPDMPDYIRTTYNPRMT